jgi:hypothetical protein
MVEFKLRNEKQIRVIKISTIFRRFAQYNYHLPLEYRKLHRHSNCICWNALSIELEPFQSQFFPLQFAIMKFYHVQTFFLKTEIHDSSFQDKK